MSAPVRTALDLQALQVHGFADRGIGRYVAAYAAALAKAGRVGAALLAPELPPPSGLADDLIVRDLVVWDCIAETRRLLAEPGRIVYHVPAPFLHVGPHDPSGLAITTHWAESAAPRVVTLYDLIPLRAPRHYLPSPAHEERYRGRARWVATADLLLAISEHTRQEAIELLGCPADRVVAVGAGVDPFFAPPDGTDDELWRFHLGGLQGRPYVLTIGGSDERKGTERLVAALGRLAAQGWDLSLVIVGDLTPDWRRRIGEAAQASGVAGRVILTGSVGDDLLRACYRRAVVTVMPSLAEGSGLPVLESASCGTPALASASTALVEVSATPLAGFDPTDADSVADAISRLLSDDGRRAEVLAAQQALAACSTWEAVVERATAALDQLGDTLPPGAWTSPPLARQVALVGPVPPLGGGIGAYNLRLLAGLPGLPGDVKAYAVTANVGVPDLPAGVRHVGVSAFGPDIRPASFDGIVYTLGNSAGHLATIELALRYPGWLWLHEVRLPAIATTAFENLDDEAFESAMSWLLARAYPGRVPAGSARRAGRSNLDLIRAGIGLVAPLAERCRGFLVNSELARRMLLLDLAPLAHHPPVHVLPPGCPPVRERHPAAAGAAGAAGAAQATEPLVVAFGVVSMSKRPDLLVDAAARAGCRLAFVGPCPPILAQVIEDRARARRIEASVQVVGTVDDHGWGCWMDQATVAVQLRESVGGESSAAVLDALASGVPVVTNLATAAEYPAGTVSLLTSSDPEDIGSHLRSLMERPDDLRSLSESGQAFAADHQFDRLARELVAVVTNWVY